ncbi:hypothetical protein, partial [Microbacterium sp. Bi128]|uniref:hypothetical protein n=1 Tax=Microbacterium sp. Bi128 TaxID=2821115 RepID=UPI001E3F9E33
MSAPPSELVPTVRPAPTDDRLAPLRERGRRLLDSRPGRALQQYGRDVLRKPQGVEPIERGAFVRVLLLWAIARAVNFGLLWGFYSIAKASRWGFGPDSERLGTFWDFLTGWDADRYGQIAAQGYPMSLPMNVSGDILPNNWAFLPVFPFLVRTLSGATGLGWQPAAVLISLAAGLGATWVMFLLLRTVTKPRAAWWAVVFFSFAPLSFLFVLGYSEGLFMLLLFSGMLLAIKRRYLSILPLALVAAYTRPGILALGLALGIVFLVRFFRRRVDPFPVREWASLMATGLTIAVAGLSWNHIAQYITGTHNAYIRTELGWWLDYVGNGEFTPFTPWFRQAGTHLGVVGIVLVIALIVAFAALLWSRPVRRLGLMVVAYAFSYGLYIFAVFLPQQSTFRLLMPMAPLMADDRWPSTSRRRAAILAGCLALQVVAILLL